MGTCASSPQEDVAVEDCSTDNAHNYSAGSAARATGNNPRNRKVNRNGTTTDAQRRLSTENDIELAERRRVKQLGQWVFFPAAGRQREDIGFYRLYTMLSGQQPQTDGAAASPFAIGNFSQASDDSMISFHALDDRLALMREATEGEGTSVPPRQRREAFRLPRRESQTSTTTAKSALERPPDVIQNPPAPLDDVTSGNYLETGVPNVEDYLATSRPGVAPAPDFRDILRNSGYSFADSGSLSAGSADSRGWQWPAHYDQDVVNPHPLESDLPQTPQNEPYDYMLSSGSSDSGHEEPWGVRPLAFPALTRDSPSAAPAGTAAARKGTRPPVASEGRIGAPQYSFQQPHPPTLVKPHAAATTTAGATPQIRLSDNKSSPPTQRSAKRPAQPSQPKPTQPAMANSMPWKKEPTSGSREAAVPASTTPAAVAATTTAKRNASKPAAGNGTSGKSEVPARRIEDLIGDGPVLRAPALRVLSPSSIGTPGIQKFIAKAPILEPESLVNRKENGLREEVLKAMSAPIDPRDPQSISLRDLPAGARFETGSQLVRKMSSQKSRSARKVKFYNIPEPAPEMRDSRAH